MLIANTGTQGAEGGLLAPGICQLLETATTGNPEMTNAKVLGPKMGPDSRTDYVFINKITVRAPTRNEPQPLVLSSKNLVLPFRIKEYDNGILKVRTPAFLPHWLEICLQEKSLVSQALQWKQGFA